jgi:hypothetical protein
MNANLVMQQAANDLDQIKRSSYPNLISAQYGTLRILSVDQLQDKIHTWLSPPDPSTNHSIACSTHHKKTAAWFFQGRIYQEWKSNGSLLWVHGKRSSCSTSYSIPLTVSCHRSRIWKKCSLVRGLFAFSGSRD